MCLKILTVIYDSNPIVADLNINSLGEKINHHHEICKEFLSTFLVLMKQK